MNTQELEHVSGRLTRIIFQGKGCFAVIVLSCGGRNVTVAGTIPQCEIGALYTIVGRWEHSRYGQQLRAVDVKFSIPEDNSGVISFLKQIDGIGDVKAKKIVDKLGSDCLSSIAKNPEVLIGIAGINENFAKKVGEVIGGKLDSADLDSVLLQLMGPKTLEKAKEEFGSTWLKLALKENPYRLICIPRVSFSKVDTWVLSTKRLSADCPERAGAIVTEVVRKAADFGHTYVEFKTVIRNARSLKLAVPISSEDQILNGVKRAVAEKMIVEVECNGVRGIALESLARAEEVAANAILDWLANPYKFGAVEKDENFE